MDNLFTDYPEKTVSYTAFAKTTQKSQWGRKKRKVKREKKPNAPKHYVEGPAKSPS